MENVCELTAALLCRWQCFPSFVAYGAVGGGTTIPFVITTALDSIRNVNDKYVRSDTCQSIRHCKYPRVCQTWIHDANTRTRAIPPYRHIHLFTPINHHIGTRSIIVRHRSLPMLASTELCSFPPVFQPINAIWTWERWKVAYQGLGCEKGADSRSRRTLLMNKLHLPIMFSRFGPSHSDPAADCANLLG